VVSMDRKQVRNVLARFGILIDWNAVYIRLRIRINGCQKKVSSKCLEMDC
jgi:hypothetical protein